MGHSSDDTLDLPSSLTVCERQPLRRSLSNTHLCCVSLSQGDCVVTVVLAEEDKVEEDVVFYLVFSGSTLHHCASTRKVSSDTLETIAPGKCVSASCTSPPWVLNTFIPGALEQDARKTESGWKNYGRICIFKIFCVYILLVPQKSDPN